MGRVRVGGAFIHRRVAGEAGGIGVVARPARLRNCPDSYHTLFAIRWVAEEAGIA